ncbi:hypothetical protein CSPX01_12308 [Colletotrichum filicis]|nr:hypothetical protein CSPX01_12308 [Colletotrichum filicis]
MDPEASVFLIWFGITTAVTLILMALWYALSITRLCGLPVVDVAPTTSQDGDGTPQTPSSSAPSKKMDV